jgi:hypothetical protein
MPQAGFARASQALVRHRCPTCEKIHFVTQGRAEIAYGRQLCCSPDCEGERRRRQRSFNLVLSAGR